MQVTSNAVVAATGDTSLFSKRPFKFPGGGRQHPMQKFAGKNQAFPFKKNIAFQKLQPIPSPPKLG